MARNAQAVAHTTETVAHLTKAVAHTVEAVARLTDSTQAGFNVVNAKIDTLVDSQIRTDEIVRNLAVVVDRQAQERRDGQTL